MAGAEADGMVESGAANGPHACCSDQLFENRLKPSHLIQGSWLLVGMQRKHMEADTRPLPQNKGLLSGHLHAG